VDTKLHEFLVKYPAFKADVEKGKKNLMTADEEQPDEFTDLGTSQRAREKEDALQQKSSAAGHKPDLFITEFEGRWLSR
jgi:hypothetical protein